MTINSAGARRRQIRLLQTMFAAAAAGATLTLFGSAPPGDVESVAPSGSAPHAAPSVVGNGGFGADGFGDGGVNDNGQTSGDIFTQNAQDQSTA
jgi:hypothetical protein